LELGGRFPRLKKPLATLTNLTMPCHFTTNEYS